MAEGRESGKAEGPEAAADCEDETSGEAKLGGWKAIGRVGKVTGQESRLGKTVGRKAIGRLWVQARAVG